MPEATRLKDGTTVPDRRLDRIAAFDTRSLQYPVRGALNAEQQEPVTKKWTAPPGTVVLNQGAEGACFPHDTLVRLSYGSHKKISDLRLGDVVVTAEGRLGEITHLMRRVANRGLVRVNISGHPTVRCTPEHPFLTQGGYVAAEDLTPGHRVAITKHNPEADGPIYPRTLVGLRNIRGVLSGEVNTGGVISTVTALPEILAKTTALGRLLGLYAAEGHTTENKVVWTFGKHEEDTLVAETIDLVKTCFDAAPRTQERPNNNSINVVLYGKAWRMLFERLIPGTSKHGDKHLSSRVTCGPSAFRRALFDGWMAGDGHVRRTEQNGVTVCKQLALDLHAIATDLGLRPVLRESHPSMNEHAATRQKRYDITVSTGGGSNRSAYQSDAAVWRNVLSVEAVEFEGFVYNIEVEGDHSYVANGVGVHNCVGFGITHELLYYPVAVRGLDATFAREKIYWVAQEADPWPGGSYPEASPRYEGTSVLYGVKAASDLGYYKEYRWAVSEKEMALGVGYLGPAIIGVDWFEGMFKPSRDGFIRPTGEKMGGHCCLITGINITAGYYTLHNSWGPSWGTGGDAKISRKDMTKLLADNGEVCIVTQRTLPPPVKKQAEQRAEAILPDND